jgi:glycosyltransferase 2 family protein
MQTTRTNAQVSPIRHESRREIAIIAGAVALFAATTVLPLQGVSAVERSVFLAVNGLPGWLDPGVQLVMRFGMFVAAPVLGLLAFLLRRPRIGTAIVVCGVSAYAVARVMKFIVERGRPAVVFPMQDVITRGAPQDGLGFPSGHAAVSTAIACAIIPLVTWRFRFWLLAIPAAVAFGRVYVGAHLPLDVVGGAAIGVAVAATYHLVLVRRTTKRLRAEEPASPDELFTSGDAARSSPLRS